MRASKYPPFATATDHGAPAHFGAIAKSALSAPTDFGGIAKRALGAPKSVGAIAFTCKFDYNKEQKGIHLLNPQNSLLRGGK